MNNQFIISKPHLNTNTLWQSWTWTLPQNIKIWHPFVLMLLEHTSKYTVYQFCEKHK